MDKLKKLGNIFLIIIDIIAVIAIILVISTFIQIKILKKNYANFFGYSIFKITTGSMSGTIEINDAVVVKNIKDVEAGDIIVCGSNGLWDNLFDQNIISILIHTNSQSPQPKLFSQLASRRIAEAAALNAGHTSKKLPFHHYRDYQKSGGNLDDITVIVGKIIQPF